MNSDNRSKVLGVITSYMYEAGIIHTQKLDESARLSEDLHFDTLDYIELVMYLEDSYQLAIQQEEAEKFVLVKDVIDYVLERIPAANKK